MSTLESIVLELRGVTSSYTYFPIEIASVMFFIVIHCIHRTIYIVVSGVFGLIHYNNMCFIISVAPKTPTLSVSDSDATLEAGRLGTPFLLNECFPLFFFIQPSSYIEPN